jgi:hypothetical protein
LFVEVVFYAVQLIDKCFVGLRIVAFVFGINEKQKVFAVFGNDVAVFQLEIFADV